MATTPYRTAYNAGANGQDLPAGLASRADSDPLIDQAHDAGRNGVDYDEWHGANVPAKGPKGAQGPKGSSGSSTGRAGSSSSRAPSPLRFLNAPRGSAGHSIAGVALGMVVYALVLSIVDYGPEGPLYWFRAKFLNKPLTTSTKSSTSSAGAVTV